MSYMNTKTASIAIVTLTIIQSGRVLCDAGNAGRISSTSISNGAWSRGDGGTTLAAGLSQIRLKPESVESPGINSSINTNEFTWQHIEITRGLFWPVDLNIGFYYNDEFKVHKWNTSIQYSFFQKPFYPSLAVRGGYSKLEKPNFVESQNYSASAASSWGYKNLSVFGNVGFSMLSIRYNESSFDDSILTQQAGLQFKLNPLSQISFARTWQESEILSNEFKFSVGL